jgi:diaminopimelate decarboxylase
LPKSGHGPQVNRVANRSIHKTGSRGARALVDPVAYTPHFSRRRGSLYCEGVPLAQITARVGTPAYIYSRAAIESAYRSLDSALSRAPGRVPHSICYAVKANSNLAVLRVLARLGSSFDVVSGGEIYRLRQIGVPGNRIVFSGVGKTREEIREALRERILLFNVESAGELELLAAEASRARLRAPASIRVNPDVAAGAHPKISTGRHQHKFGVDWPEAQRLYRAHRASRAIEWQGISAHIGSQILRVDPYLRALARMAAWVKQLRAEGIALRYLDAGGGLGIRYADERPFTAAQYAQAVTRAVAPTGCHLLIEPGRYIVGPVGILLMRVLYTKVAPGGKHFVIVDAAMNDFMRPALYGAAHPITPVVAHAESRARRIRADIAGPVCETGDCFLHDWPIDEPHAADLLALWGAGAYGFVESSNYNARPRPAEVLVEGSRFRVVRKRESRADLIRGE